ncbi:MAG: M23 family metallopeptidase [Patescibacteria group bacterium]|nr:M23 family metallopeptidase [Patescibacteria group bacterium]
MDNKYLALPVRGKYRITEGWLYSDQEKKIHGLDFHGGVDFAQPRNSPVFAAADGWAIASYSLNPFFDEKTGKLRRFRGKIVGMGLGNFVQIYHPQTKRFTQYGHLEKISEKIPFAKPRKLKDGRLIPMGHKINPRDLKNYPKAIWVRCGEVIGYVGDSGLTWEYNDYPNRPDHKKHPSWDETHVHFEEFVRNSRGAKQRRDPFAIYDTNEKYPWPGHKGRKGDDGLWIK